MARTVCIAAPIADTGKTIAAVNFAASLAVFEKKTLLVDCCPENPCIFGAKVEVPENPAGLAEALEGQDEQEPFRHVQTRLDFLEILPAGNGLENAADKLAIPGEASEHLSSIISRQAGGYEFAVIDTPTPFSWLCEAALRAADELLIPLRVDPAGAEYIEQGLVHIKGLLEKTAGLKKQGKTAVNSARILINCCSDLVEAEALLGPDFYERIQSLCLEVCIPEDIRLHEAYWFGKPAACYDITAPGASAFLDLAALWAGGQKAGITEKEVPGS